MNTERPITTRFAPSPTGLLHLGHAYAAIFAHDLAKSQEGRFLLRIEDIDEGRARPEFEDQILEDLSWLDLTWEEPIRRQSEHISEYQDALQKLMDKGLTYPCFCTRKEIQTEVKNIANAPHGPEGVIYPGTCRKLEDSKRDKRIGNGDPFAIRLNIETAVQNIKEDLTFNEEGFGPDGESERQPVDPFLFGDIVLGRKDLGIGYHLAVTYDDHLQGVTHVTRGEDLFYASHIQRLLQTLLGFNTPTYHHHKLIYHESGRRLAKRDKDETLKSLRERGVSPDQIREQLELPIIQS